MKGRLFMNKLTPDHLLLLNQKITGGEKESALCVSYQELEKLSDIPYEKDREVFYELKDVKQKAAKLGNLIATRKPFKRCNEETAALALLTLLEINGKNMMNYSQDIQELYACLGDENTETICKWIEAHMAKKSL